LLSSFAFKSKMRRYTAEPLVPPLSHPWSLHRVVGTDRQGLTLVHFSAEPELFLTP
jgi:hypothetical protein